MEKIQEYNKNYYDLNKDGIVEYNKEYREKNKEELKEKKHEYYENNKEEVNNKKKEHRENNKEEILKKEKEYRVNNKDIINEKKKIHYEQNKEEIHEKNKEIVECKYCKREVTKINLKRHQTSRNCCNPNTVQHYVRCDMDEPDCIDTVICDNGRVRRVINNVETCVPDSSLNFERCEDGEDNCVDDMKCSVGFKIEGDDCIVDREKHFICTDNSLNSDTCIGGDVKCEDGYYYSRSREVCMPGSNINDQGQIECKRGFTVNERGSCSLQEIKNNRPTNFVFENNQLKCKEGYKLTDNEIPSCVIDRDKKWTCDNRSSINDGELCCDPQYFQNKLVCSSRPICPENYRQIEDECIFNEEELVEDCEGNWSRCRSDCKDSIFIVTKKREGLGKSCKDEAGNILKTGDRKSCKNSGSCTKYNDLLCGANLSNVVIEDSENWSWKWNYNITRERCDKTYDGNMKNCKDILYGDNSTRYNCDLYENKCLGNTQKSQDVNCYEIDKIPVRNAYNIDKVGDGYDSCCEEYNPLSILRKDIKSSEKERKSKLREILKIKDDESDKLSQLIR